LKLKKLKKSEKSEKSEKSKKVENIEVKEVSGPPTLQAPKGRSTPAEGEALGIRE
jgi:hypothetical protein